MSKNRSLKMGLALTAGIALQGLVGMSTAAAAQLSYGTLQSPLHVVVTEGVTPFFEDVERRSDGELTGRVFPSSQLLSARGALKGISDGVADSGFLVPAYHATQLPHLTVLSNLSKTGDNPLAIAAALNETILLKCEDCLEDYQSNGAFPLVSYNTTNYVLQCNKPVRERDDLKGLQVRSTGIMSEELAALGANSVNLASSESAEALERGQVDCIHGPMTWLRAFGLQGSVSHITDAFTGSYRGLGGMVISQDKLNELPEEQRKALFAAAPAMVAGIMFGQLKQDTEIKNWARDNGIEVLSGSAELREALASSPGGAALKAKRAEAVGVDDHQQVEAMFRNTLRKWEGIVQGLEGEREAYTDALWREIYSKL